MLFVQGSGSFGVWHLWDFGVWQPGAVQREVVLGDAAGKGRIWIKAGLGLVGTWALH